MGAIETPSAAPDRVAIRWIGYGLAALGTVLAVLIMFMERAPAQAFTVAAIVVQAAFLVLIERAPQAFMVTSRRSRQPIINFALVIPPVALIVAGSDAQLVHSEIGALVAVAAAALGLLIAVWAPRSAKVASPIIFGLFVGAFAAGLGWGGMILVDRVFDSMPAQVYETTVRSKFMTYGRGRGYHVAVAPWGPFDRSDNIGVSGTLYDRVSVGGPICVRLHPGALGLAWYRAGVC
jgi:hypothetical protein